MSPCRMYPAATAGRTGVALAALFVTTFIPTARGRNLFELLQHLEPRGLSPQPGPQRIVLSRPVVVHMGPAVDAGLGEGALPELPLLLQGMMGIPVLGPSMPAGGDPFEEMGRGMSGFLQSLESGGPGASHGGFQVSQEKGNFSLHAVLPGYKMHNAKDGKVDPDNNQPLSVEVVGRSLVIRGQQTSDHMTQGFQRSFQVPRAANVDAIQVTYNVTDGALAVDIPAKEGADDKKGDADDDDDVWRFGSQDSGSHTTMTFSSGGGSAPTALRGARSPFPDLLEDLMGFPGRERGPGPAGDPIIKLLEQLNGDDADDEPEGRSASAADARAPVVVHPQNAQPFWRLVDEGEEPGAKLIEVVAPKGVHTGKPEGRHVPMYKKAGAEPIGRMKLPVDVNGEGCSWAAKGASKDRVLRCGVEKEAVKKVPIHVLEEL